MRDYRSFDWQLQYRCRVLETPYQAYFDYSRNVENYNVLPAQSFSAFHEGDVDCSGFGCAVGDKGGAGDWGFGY